EDAFSLVKGSRDILSTWAFATDSPKKTCQRLFSKTLVKSACQKRLKKARPCTVIERSQALLLKRYN
ncbi:MAG: hypothetical protein VW390_07540, partial [Gammaproteobacteria bacterium]